MTLRPETPSPFKTRHVPPQEEEFTVDSELHLKRVNGVSEVVL